MSALFQGIPLMQGNNGELYVRGASTAPHHYHNGLPYEATGALCVTTDPVAYYHQGLGFSAEGRICRTNELPDYFGSGAAPFSTVEPGKHGNVEQPPNHYSSGVPYVDTSLMAMSFTPPPFFFDFDQSDFLAGDFA